VERRKGKAGRFVWQERRPLDWKKSHKLLKTATYTDEKGNSRPCRRVQEETELAAREICRMVKRRKVHGLAGIALHPDGRIKLFAVGAALDDFSRSIGGVGQLEQLLRDLDRRISDGEEVL